MYAISDFRVFKRFVSPITSYMKVAPVSFTGMSGLIYSVAMGECEINKKYQNTGLND